MRLLSLLVLSLIACLGVSFAILNAEPVKVEYYIGSRSVPLSFLLVGVLIIGMILGLLTTLPTLLKLKFENRRLRRGYGGKI